ncbi:MAG: PTS sugar transporter subunit IIB [Erysipelotrichaceae bacterium]|nr:PTS sugar transporter subunit IIB [Erysipelotrichaceae bacterium]
MKNIVLICGAGMSSSLLVLKMRTAAEKLGYECEINAYPVVDAVKMGETADVLLMGPQIRFEFKKVAAQLKCPAEVIEMRDYGTMNGEAVLKRAIELIEGATPKK